MNSVTLVKNDFGSTFTAISIFTRITLKLVNIVPVNMRTFDYAYEKLAFILPVPGSTTVMRVGDVMLNADIHHQSHFIFTVMVNAELLQQSTFEVDQKLSTLYMNFEQYLFLS